MSSAASWWRAVLCEEIEPFGRKMMLFGGKWSICTFQNFLSTQPTWSKLHQNRIQIFWNTPHQFGGTVFFKVIFKKRSKESAFAECLVSCKERVWSRHFNETRVQRFGKCPTRFPCWETSGCFASVKKWNTLQCFLCKFISREIHFFVSI